MHKVYLFLFFALSALGIKAQTISYTYDNLNRLTKVVYPDSSAIVYNYDAAGNRSSLRISNICFIKSNPVISTLGNLRFCSGDSVKLTSTDGERYTWSNGDSAKTIVVKKSGKYAVTTRYSSSCSKTSDSITVVVIPLPTAKINPGRDTGICAGDSALLTATAVNGATYAWSTSDSSSSIVVKITGTYVLKVKDQQNGCSDSAMIKISVNPVPQISSFTNQSTCYGVPVRIGALADSVYKCTWSPGKYLTDSLTASPLASPPLTTTFVLTATNQYQCTAKRNMTLTVQPLPNVTVIPSGPLTFCAGDSVVLNGSSTSDTSFLWSTGSRSKSIVAKATGIYKLKVAGTNGCADSTTIVVTVNPAPQISSYANLSTCYGLPVRIGTLTDSVYKCTWSPGKYLTDSLAANPLAAPPVTTTFFLTARNQYQCVAKKNMTLTVLNLPNVTVTPNGPTTFCSGDSVVLNGNSTTDTGFLWSNGSRSKSIVAKTTGNYTLKVTGTNGCIDSATVMVIVNPLPDITGLTDRTTCFGVPIQIGSVANGIYNCVWSPTTYLSNPTSAATLASPISTIRYTMTARNINNCVSQKGMTVTILPLPSVSIIPSGATTFCVGDSVRLTGNSPTAAAYKWSSGAISQTIAVKTQGTYKLTLTGNNGCLDSTSVEVKVNPLPDIKVVSDRSVCYGSGLTIGAASNAAYVCSWTPLTGLDNPSLPDPFVFPLVPTTYTIKATSADKCIATRQVNIGIYSLPIVKAGIPGIVNLSTGTQLGGSPTASGNGPFRYQWKPTIAQGADTTANPLAKPVNTTLYKLLVTDKNTCTNTDSVLIRVIPWTDHFSYYYPGRTTAIATLVGTDIPAPVCYLQLFDINSKTLNNEVEVPVVNHAILYTFSMANLSSGMYILRIRFNDQIVSVKVMKGD